MKKNRAKYINMIDLTMIDMDKLTVSLEPHELAILIYNLPLTSENDIMLENMRDYFVENDEWSYAIVTRDEIYNRNGIINASAKADKINNVIDDRIID